MGTFETMIKEQMIAEYPAMDVEGKTFTYSTNGMTFKSADEVCYFLANKMWDAFDNTLDYIEDKGEQYGED